MANLPGGNIRQMPPDNVWTLGLPIPATAQIPFLDTAADTGKFIKAMVLKRDEVLGRDVLAATYYKTGAEALEAFKRTFPEAGKTARFFEIPHQMFLEILKGRGLPEKAGGHGDLYAHVRIMLPEGGDSDLEALMRGRKS